MYVCMYVYVCGVPTRMFAREGRLVVPICMYVCMYVYVCGVPTRVKDARGACISMYACMYECVYVYVAARETPGITCMYVCVCICMSR
jgi:hypothetical protein